MEEANVQNEEKKELPVEKKKRFVFKKPSFLSGDMNQPKDDWKFGLAFSVAALLVVFSDILVALAATIILFLGYGYMEKQGKIV